MLNGGDTVCIKVEQYMAELFRDRTIVLENKSVTEPFGSSLTADLLAVQSFGSRTFHGSSWAELLMGRTVQRQNPSVAVEIPNSDPN